MTDNNAQQVSLGKAIQRLHSTPAGYPAVATILLVLMLFVPLATVVMGALSGRAGAAVPGLDYLGWYAWIPVFTFAAATLTRLVPQAMPYRNLVDRIAFASIIATVVWAIMGGDVGAELRQAKAELRKFGGSSAANGLTYVIYPHIGAALLVLAPVLLFLGRVRSTGVKGVPTGRNMDMTSPWLIAAVLSGLAAIGFALGTVAGIIMMISDVRRGAVSPLFAVILIVGLFLVTALATYGCRYIFLKKLGNSKDIA